MIATRHQRLMWFYEGTPLGYRTFYVWFAEDNLMITVQTNSEPPQGEHQLGKAVVKILNAIETQRSRTSP